MVEISTLQSLLAIVGILVLTVLLSLLSPKGKAKTAIGRLRRRLADWQDLQDGSAPPAERQAAYAGLVQAEREVLALPEAYRRELIEERQSLREQIADAHARQATTNGSVKAS